MDQYDYDMAGEYYEDGMVSERCDATRRDAALHPLVYLSNAVLAEGALFWESQDGREGGSGGGHVRVFLTASHLASTRLGEYGHQSVREQPREDATRVGAWLRHTLTHAHVTYHIATPEQFGGSTMTSAILFIHSTFTHTVCLESLTFAHLPLSSHRVFFGPMSYVSGDRKFRLRSVREAPPDG